MESRLDAEWKGGGCTVQEQGQKSKRRTTGAVRSQMELTIPGTGVQTKFYLSL